VTDGKEMNSKFHARVQKGYWNGFRERDRNFGKNAAGTFHIAMPQQRAVSRRIVVRRTTAFRLIHPTSRKLAFSVT